MINVFHIVSNKIWSGPEQYAYDLALRLRNDDNYYIEVVCKKSEAVFNKFRSLEIPVSILPLKGLTDLDSPVRFARLLKRGQNIIHVHTFHDAFAAIWAKHIAENPNTRIVLTLHGVNRPRINYLSKKVYRDLDRIVFVSQRSYDEFVPRITRLDRKKCVIVRDSVLPARSEKLAQAPQLRQQLGIGSDQALIMYHGRLSHDKGLDVLLRAITQLDSSKYHR
ncbi:MAG: glycosyltransferase [Sodaliphilus pleomorphus]|uniref:glycosyltransferase n=1 Tax=Sodaliphilus pleomorphus TaxID=2606626 RepID=UPI002A759083|nr:glycosyltransferase [Sodaliphilus pleomorphus]MDY2832395.1 glycosyltransferase [Sodaliphilus pleomorphus]